MLWILDRISGRWALLSLSLILAFAFFLRCLHLFNTENYYILSADSYFFHWLGGRILAGEPPPPDMRPEAIYTLHTGLAYPMAYMAKAVSHILNFSSYESLEILGKALPPIIGIISAIAIYLGATKIWDRRVGLFSSFSWALMFIAVFVGSSGYLDRDGLTILLLILGAFLFYFLRHWKWRIGNIDVGWILVGCGVLLMEALLYLEWSFVGPLLLLAIIFMYALVKFFLELIENKQNEVSSFNRVQTALGVVNWRSLSLIFVANVILVILAAGASSWLGTVTAIVGAQGSIDVLELRGLSFSDLIYSFGLFLIPLVAGLYITWKQRNDGSIFFSCWFVCLLVVSFFSVRVLYFAIPAASVLSGLGLFFIWDWQRQGESRTWRKAGVVVLLCLLILISFVMVPYFGSDSLIAVDREWQDALAYVRDNTEQNAVIMTQWGWGFWILDLGERKPFMDNGFYGYDDARMHDVALAYTATQPAEAVEIMQKYGADYLVFSELDLMFEETILRWAELDDKYDAFPDGCLFTLSMNGDFKAGDGLEVTYRNSEVVILRLADVR